MDPVVTVVVVVCATGFAITVVALGFAAFQEYLKHRAQAQRSETEQLRRQMEELQHRVEVLEGIVASPEFTLFCERMRQIQAEATKSLPSSSQPIPTSNASATQTQG